MSDEMQESNEVEVNSDIENTNVGAESSTAAEDKPLTGYDKRISVLTARGHHQNSEIAQLKAENATLQPPKL